MKKLISKLIMLIAASTIMSSQEYTITIDPIYNYTIDRFTNEIYYMQWYIDRQEVHKVDFDGSNNVNTDFESTPFFANNSHKALIVEWKSVTGDFFIYDFNTKEKTVLFNIYHGGVPPDISFSPNDSLLYISNEPIIYYSFKDSLVHIRDTLFLYDSKPIWHKDSDKLIFLKNRVVKTYSISENKFDTLVSAQGYNEITSFSYNSKTNLLAYGYQGYGEPDSSLVYTLNLNDSTTKIVFSSINSVLNQDNYSGGISKMKWNNEGTQLAFTTVRFITPHVENFYCYKMDTDTTYQYAKDNDGYTYQLNWLDSNRISYENATYGSKLMGYKFDIPVSVEKIETNSYGVNVTAYPNPFNSEANIEFNIPDRSNVIITIYNILGEKIDVLLNEIKEKGYYHIKWKAKSNNNNSLPTGIYIVSLSAKTMSNIIYKKSLKILNLK